MQYALMLYAEPGAAETLSADEREAAATAFAALADDPRVVSGGQLQPTEMATSVRVAGGRTLTTDGPFADTKEVLGGFAVIEAADLDEVIDLAGRIPTAKYGVVEIRPLAPR